MKLIVCLLFMLTFMCKCGHGLEFVRVIRLTVVSLKFINWNFVVACSCSFQVSLLVFAADLDGGLCAWHVRVVVGL